MIASLAGILTAKSTHQAVVEANGVGYQVFIPLSTYYHLPELNETIRLHTYTHVREDALQLYGFLRTDEKAVFLLLIGVSGIGPKLSLNILSGIPLEEFVRAVRAGDVAKLATIPGVGRKTAERLVVELKDKIETVSPGPAAPADDSRPDGEGFLSEDAVSALVNLGYKAAPAKEAVRRVFAVGGRDQTMEALIKDALRLLAK